jgi:hypothetical protein
MQKQNKYAIIGFKALRRAAEKVAMDAKKNNYKIPIWKNGHIEYKIPEITADKSERSDARSSID